MVSRLDQLALSGTRLAIDHIDDRMVVLFSRRQHLAALAGTIKTRAGMHRLDSTREREVIARARNKAQRCGLEPDHGELLMSLLIAHAHQRQCNSELHDSPSQAPTMSKYQVPQFVDLVLRALPPPRYWRLLAKRVPLNVQNMAIPRLLTEALASAEAWKGLQPIAGRRICIEVTDLALGWVLTLEGEQLRPSTGVAEATVSGSMTDLLLLASRLEDADTLFFQRRLMLTGDTELGLLLRNLLDRMPWESFPLGLRIMLQRSTRLLQRARTAHQSRRVAA